MNTDLSSLTAELISLKEKIEILIAASTPVDTSVPVKETFSAVNYYKTYNTHKIVCDVCGVSIQARSLPKHVLSKEHIAQSHK